MPTAPLPPEYIIHLLALNTFRHSGTSQCEGKSPHINTGCLFYYIYYFQTIRPSVDMPWAPYQTHFVTSTADLNTIIIIVWICKYVYVCMETFPSSCVRVRDLNSPSPPLPLSPHPTHISKCQYWINRQKVRINTNHDIKQSARLASCCQWDLQSLQPTNFCLTNSIYHS